MGAKIRDSFLWGGLTLTLVIPLIILLQVLRDRLCSADAFFVGSPNGGLADGLPAMVLAAAISSFLLRYPIGRSRWGMARRIGASNFLKYDFLSYLFVALAVGVLGLFMFSTVCLAPGGLTRRAHTFTGIETVSWADVSRVTAACRPARGRGAKGPWIDLTLAMPNGDPIEWSFGPNHLQENWERLGTALNSSSFAYETTFAESCPSDLKSILLNPHGKG